MLIRQFFHHRFCELHQYVRQGFFTKFLRVDKSRSSTLINTKYDTNLKIQKARTEIGKCVLINFQNLWLYLRSCRPCLVKSASFEKLPDQSSVSSRLSTICLRCPSPVLKPVRSLPESKMMRQLPVVIFWAMNIQIMSSRSALPISLLYYR